MKDDIVSFVQEIEQPLRSARNYTQAILMAAKAMNDEEGAAVNELAFDALSAIDEIQSKWKALNDSGSQK